MDPSPINAQHTYLDIAEAMERCLVVKNRYQRLKMHKECFVGREAVDFLKDYLHLASRKEALRVGREMNEHIQCFEHVSRAHKLKDGNIFYRFTDYNNRKTCSLEEAARAFQQGVQVEDQTVRMRTYKKCFKGKHAVDFLVNNKYAATRAEAVVLARRLQTEYDLFHSVSGNQRFKDENVFYRMLMPKIGSRFQRTSDFLKQAQGLIEIWLLILGCLASSLYIYLFKAESVGGIIVATTLVAGAAVEYYIFGSLSFVNLPGWLHDKLVDTEDAKFEPSEHSEQLDPVKKQSSGRRMSLSNKLRSSIHLIIPKDTRQGSTAHNLRSSTQAMKMDNTGNRISRPTHTTGNTISQKDLSVSYPMHGIGRLRTSVVALNDRDMSVSSQEHPRHHTSSRRSTNRSARAA